MKSYHRAATGRQKNKRSTNEDHAGRDSQLAYRGPTDPPDKTVHMTARPGAKQKIRCANRAINKKARQALKRDLTKQLSD